MSSHVTPISMNSDHYYHLMPIGGGQIETAPADGEKYRRGEAYHRLAYKMKCKRGSPAENCWDCPEEYANKCYLGHRDNGRWR